MQDVIKLTEWTANKYIYLQIYKEIMNLKAERTL